MMARREEHADRRHSGLFHFDIESYRREDPDSYTPTDQPYIGLKAKLTRAYATHIVFSILLILSMIFVLSQSLQNHGDQAKQRLESACTAMEVASTALASIPHYSARTVNTATVKTINAMMNQVGHTLAGAVHLLNSLVLYLLRRYQRLLLCVLDTLITAGVNAVSNYADQITSFLNTQLAGINGAVNSGLSVVNGKANIQIPRDFVDTLRGLKDKVPTLDDVEAKLGDLISTPFKALEGLIETRMANLSSLANVEGFVPVPDQASDIRFCEGHLDVGWVDTVVHALTMCLGIAAGVLILVALLVIAFNALLIIYDHVRFERGVRAYAGILRERGLFGNGVSGADTVVTDSEARSQARDLIHAASNPTLYAMTLRLTNRFFKSPTSRTRARWFLDYVSHKPSMICLAAGLLGLIFFGLQIWLIGVVKSGTANIVATEMETSVDKVTDLVTGALYGVAHPYVASLNAKLDGVEVEANDVLFGWLNGTFDAINNTVSTFTTGFTDVLNSALAPVPPLRDAVMQFTNCLLGSSLESLETIATDLRTKMHVSLPRVNDSSVAQIDGPGVRQMLARSAQMMGNKNGQNGTVQAANVDSGSLFRTELEDLLDAYKRTLQKHITPFIWLTFFGASVIFVGLGRVALWTFHDRKKAKTLPRRPSLPKLHPQPEMTERCTSTAPSPLPQSPAMPPTAHFSTIAPSALARIQATVPATPTPDSARSSWGDIWGSSKSESSHAVYEPIRPVARRESAASFTSVDGLITGKEESVGRRKGLFGGIRIGKR
ncbi:plasma membrane fusion protein prm1 [Borealophlyctis nickersoniae]|nr:plasma membrane fusion protein prm1 [Borealophlyctis nickersoniae]